ncbi:unnamed protein product [Vicia faba]|uniref:Uncharacterized protein n=1 Tax=Vicia faba TaxID=3906 RepID=A0AAV1ABP2_VICFA|nr:unnamed protein product [Vicia faba]
MRRNQTTRASPPMSIAIVDVILVELKLPVLQHLIRFWLLNLMMIHEENFFQKEAPLNTVASINQARYFFLQLIYGVSYCHSMKEQVEEAAAGNDSPGDAVGDRGSNGTRAGMVATVEALEAAADAGKLVDTEAPVDQGTESNEFRQVLWQKKRIEGIVGFRVPENHGRSHQLILTFRNYKRRRGIF